MTQRTLTPAEAFRDFIEVVFPDLFEPPVRRNRDYNRIKQAVYAERKGLLTDEWVKKILTTYAPERYTFVETVTVVVME